MKNPFKKLCENVSQTFMMCPPADSSSIINRLFKTKQDREVIAAYLKELEDEEAEAEKVQTKSQAAQPSASKTSASPAGDRVAPQRGRP